MMKSKIKSNVDYHEIRDGALIQHINCAKYDSDGAWRTLEELFSMDLDFIDMLFLKLTGRRPVQTERKLFLKTLMILSFGTGCHPPSVMVPKLIASTTKNKEFAIINGLIGGLATVGTDHLGAVTGIMKTLKCIKEEINDNMLKKGVEEYVEVELSNGNKIMGFGHPVYKADPRPAMVLKEIRSMCRSNTYVKVYEQLRKTLYEKKKIQPNIDAILALSYLVLGFEPEHGIYLSFLSRSLSMVCHILEEFPKKPFSFLNEMVSIEDFYSKLSDSERLSIEINEKVKKMQEEELKKKILEIEV